MIKELSWEQLGQNVGSEGRPESLLHRYACAMVWNELHHRGSFTGTPWQRKDKIPVIVNTPTGPSNDLWSEVMAYEMGTYLNGVLGHVPDLIGRGPDGVPVRVIEVVVTSTPTKDYRDLLTKHQVELVEIHVPDDAALSKMFVPAEPWYANLSKVKVRRGGFAPTLPNYLAKKFIEGSFRARQDHANSGVAGLINDLRDCDPSYRRDFLELLREMEGLDSLIPVFAPESNPFLKGVIADRESGTSEQTL